MLNIDVEACACCGSVWPVQDDLLLGNKTDAKEPITSVATPFRRHHFQELFYDAYLCTCSGFCKGTQFYVAACPTQKGIFLEQHGLTVDEALQSPNRPVTMTRICCNCY